MGKNRKKKKKESQLAEKKGRAQGTICGPAPDTKTNKTGLSDAGEPMDNERIGELESTFYERIADEAGATLKDASQDLALMKDQTEKYVGEKVEEGKQSLRKTGKQEAKKMVKQAVMLKKEIKDSHGKGHGIYIGHSENTHIGDETTYNIGSTRDDTDEGEDAAADEGYTKDYPHLSPTLSLNESGDTGARPKTSSSAWKNLPNRVSIDKAESVHIGEKNSPDKIFEESNFFLATNKTEISSASTVNISFNQDLKSGIPTDKSEEIKKFAEAVNNFQKKGSYMLLMDEPTFVPNIDALSLVDWLAVFDMDCRSWDTGLLSRISDSVDQKLKYVSWKENVAISKQQLTWIGLMGISNRPETNVSEEFREWKRKVKPSLESQLKQIQRYAEQYTKVTLIVLLPENKHVAKLKHFNFIIEEVLEIIPDIRIVAAVPKYTYLSEVNHVQLKHLQIDDDVKKIYLSLFDVCNVVQAYCLPERAHDNKRFRLPTSDGTNDAKLKEKENAWLANDLEVLYLDNVTGIEYSSEQLDDEEQTFHKGGTIPWSVWYALGGNRFDVQRDIHAKMVDYIMRRHIGICRSGFVRLLHNPGSGGTTLAQRVVWELKDEVPCVQIKHRLGSMTSDIFEKIKFLYSKTNKPILILIDGEEEHKVNTIRRSLEPHVPVILLYVQRSWARNLNDSSSINTFRLQRAVSKEEVKHFRRMYMKQCKDTTEGANEVERLFREVEMGKEHDIFEFGLAVHDIQYAGIEKYVAGYLRLNGKSSRSELNPWQQALGYLSLVYFYGQSSMPCHFFTDIIESEEPILTKSDLPDEMQELIVNDSNDINENMVRISHYLIAKEILDQILPLPRQVPHELSLNLSIESMRKLKGISVELINVAGKKNTIQSSTIAQIMTNTFISRNNRATGENETQAGKKRKPQISPILEQASSHSPYTERFDIMKQLVKSFPLEAQFKAHLGRLYSLYRSEEEKTAERYLKEAEEMCLQGVNLSDLENVPANVKYDLMMIFHMYGRMLSLQANKIIGGKGSTDNNMSSSFEQDCKEVLPKIKKACGYFYKSREMAHFDSDGSLGYLSEIEIRLKFCDFVHKNSGCPDVLQYMHTFNTDTAEFIKECVTVVDELFLDSFSSFDSDKFQGIYYQQELYSALFKNIPGHTIIGKGNNVQSRRLEIAQIKMKYCDPYAYGVLERIDNPEDIQFIAERYEKNIDEYENQVTPTASKRQINNDYREWIYIIRHPLFKTRYTVVEVLQRVEAWNEKVDSEHSRFYMFVLCSILGFGLEDNLTNAELLFRAQTYKEKLMKTSWHIHKPRYPREWLGKPQRHIHRIVPGKRYLGWHDGRDILLSSNIEVCKGTIVCPNDKPSRGFIDLDLGPRNLIPVKIFFVPARAEEDLTGPVNEGARVEFVIAFSMYGYEAYNVRLLRKMKCPTCRIDIEHRSVDDIISCPRCHTSYPVNRRRRGQKTRLNNFQ